VSFRITAHLFDCHREERSDAAIQLKFMLDCHARRAGRAMTNPEFVAMCAKRAVVIQLDCFVAALLAMTAGKYWLTNPAMR
jgi:hypothetical protein